MAQTVEIPADLFKEWLRSTKALLEYLETFEDFLAVKNPRLLRELRKARREHREHLSKKTPSWEELKREFPDTYKRLQ